MNIMAILGLICLTVGLVKHVGFLLTGIALYTSAMLIEAVTRSSK